MNPQTIILNRAIEKFQKHLKYSLHPEDRAELDYVQGIADRINEHFKLSHVCLVNPISTDLLWGMCDYQRGIIHLLFRFPKADWRIERRMMLRVLCHEMTHFRVLGHQDNFFTLCNQIIDYCREITNEPKIKYESFTPSNSSCFGY